MNWAQYNINLAIIVSLFAAIFVILARKRWMKYKEDGIKYISSQL
jgi:hypothetical protein